MNEMPVRFRSRQPSHTETSTFPPPLALMTSSCRGICANADVTNPSIDDMCSTDRVLAREAGMTTMMNGSGSGSVVEVDAESEPFSVLSIELSVGRGAAEILPQYL